jgi:transcription elongation factor Elf1
MGSNSEINSKRIESVAMHYIKEARNKPYQIICQPRIKDTYHSLTNLLCFESNLFIFTMARRKSRSNNRPVKPKLKLDTVFRCPFCQLENSVGCSFDKDLNIGEISCSICHAGYETKLTPLTEPIDIYCEWIDECERVNQKS